MVTDRCRWLDTATGGVCVVGHSIGIDLSINSAHDCTVLDATGQLVQRLIFDSLSAGWQKLENHICGIDSPRGARIVVMEPSGLAWFLAWPLSRAASQHPAARIKTSRVAARAGT
jgi:hypothetical protein